MEEVRRNGLYTSEDGHDPFGEFTTTTMLAFPPSTRRRRVLLRRRVLYSPSFFSVFSPSWSSMFSEPHPSPPCRI